MQYSPKQKLYLWLDTFPLTEREKPQLSVALLRSENLVREFPQIFEKTVKTAKKSVYNNMLSSLTDGGNYLRSYLGKLEKGNIFAIFREDNDFPNRLKDCPFVCYGIGDRSLLNTEKFCIVGSRQTSTEVVKKTTAIAKELSESFTILSGVAEGGDTAAIRGGLEGSGKVVCVVAGGLFQLPKLNPFLAEVKKKGLLFSYLAPDTPAREFSYERRNDVLASLAVGGLVVSASEKSGALITAKYLRKQEKPLFALPYAPDTLGGEGCNTLIKKGATLCERASDILSRFGKETAPTEQERKQAVELDKDEEKVVKLLKKEGTASLTFLSEKTGLPVFRLNAVVTALEMKGLVVRTAGNNVTLVGKALLR